MSICEATFWDIFKTTLAAGLGATVAFAPWVIVMLWRDQRRDERWRRQAEADRQRWEASHESWR